MLGSLLKKTPQTSTKTQHMRVLLLVLLVLVLVYAVFPSRDICPVTLDVDMKCEAIMAGGHVFIKTAYTPGRDTVNQVS